jgi:hypothetical protein
MAPSTSWLAKSVALMSRRVGSAASAPVRGNRGGGLEAGDGQRAACAGRLRKAVFVRIDRPCNAAAKALRLPGKGGAHQRYHMIDDIVAVPPTARCRPADRRNGKFAAQH